MAVLTQYPAVKPLPWRPNTIRCRWLSWVQLISWPLSLFLPVISWAVRSWPHRHRYFVVIGFIYFVVVIVLTIVFSCIGMINNYRMWRNVFGMSSMPWHQMDNSSLEVIPAFLSELTHYYLTLAWVWHVSYFNPP